MTQRIFDIENEKDMQDLWDILPDEAYSIKKSMGCQIWRRKGEDAGYYFDFVNINWHDKTEITRPIQEATEKDIGKICYFWNDDDPPEYGQLLYVFSSPEDREGKYQQGHNDGSWSHCRRLTKQEIEELC
jgi:hypothetical protein